MDKVQEIVEELKVSISKEEKKKQVTLRKKKRDARAATLLSTSCFYRSSTTVSVFNLSTLFTSAQSTGSIGPMSGSSAPSAFTQSTMLVSDFSTLPALAGSTRSTGPISDSSTLSVSIAFAISVLCLSALFTSTLFTSIGSAMPIPSLSTLFTSAPSIFVPSTFSESAMPMLGLSTSIASVFELSAFFALVVIHCNF